MTPAARYAAAIDLLDQISDGTPAEKCLTHWARQNRFAGSGDRAAIRDHVYDVLRARRSLAALGGGDTGRALILGLLRRDGIDPAQVFGAGGYGPAPLTVAESAAGRSPQPGAEACDIPDWLWPHWQEALGSGAEAAARIQQQRGPVCLRVNLRRGTRAAAQAALKADGIETVPADAAPTALLVTAHPRRVAGSAAYREGLVEVQDLASQMAMLRMPLQKGAGVLDYCAGGGGKALALADLGATRVAAHDIDPARMADLPARAARAGVTIDIIPSDALAGQGGFDLVLCDAPCSGSGTWRRTPEAKWQLSQEKLNDYNAMQSEVLTRARQFVHPGGYLAYATCSVLTCENEAMVTAFLDENPGWSQVEDLTLTPSQTHDGFYIALMHNLR